MGSLWWDMRDIEEHGGFSGGYGVSMGSLWDVVGGYGVVMGAVGSPGCRDGRWGWGGRGGGRGAGRLAPGRRWSPSHRAAAAPPSGALRNSAPCRWASNTAPPAGGPPTQRPCRWTSNTAPPAGGPPTPISPPRTIAAPPTGGPPTQTLSPPITAPSIGGPPTQRPLQAVLQHSPYNSAPCRWTSNTALLPAPPAGSPPTQRP